MNVSTNMINNLRENFPQAFLYGFTIQYEEPRNGLDTSLNLTGTHRLLAFQFKKPKRSRGDIFWFEFNNNKFRFNQHNILHRTADVTAPIPTIFYALPIYLNMTEFENDSPNFLNNTYFINVLETALIFDNMPHEFEIDTQQMTFQTHSKSTLGEGKLYDWKTIHEKILSEEIGVDVTVFKEKIKNFKILKSKKSFDEKLLFSRLFLHALIL